MGRLQRYDCHRRQRPDIQTIEKCFRWRLSTDGRPEKLITSSIKWSSLEMLAQSKTTSTLLKRTVISSSSSGKTALIYAACERYPAIVKLLLARGADPNSLSRDSRTPLMEAALWGRFENVQHILKHGAARHIKDRYDFRAIDFATPSDLNEKERFKQSGGEHQVYTEHSSAQKDLKTPSPHPQRSSPPPSRPVVSTPPTPSLPLHSPISQKHQTLRLSPQTCPQPHTPSPLLPAQPIPHIILQCHTILLLLLPLNLLPLNTVLSTCQCNFGDILHPDTGIAFECRERAVVEVGLECHGRGPRGEVMDY